MTAASVETQKSNPSVEGETGEKRGKATGPRTLPFLLEVGCEEIPARFLRDAEKSLGERVQAALSEARLLPATAVGAVRDPSPEGFGPQGEPPLRTYSTPRRLVVHLPALLAQQPDKVEEILGPPVKVAVDAGGKYTRAAESFAQKNSACLEDLVRTTTPKGEYLALRKIAHGRSAQEMLPEVLPAAIPGLSFPKSMYWTAKSDPRFVRPIRWMLALLGEGQQARTVDFEILGVKSEDFTFGHRAKSRQPQRVTGFKDYTRKLARAHVEIDPARRLERVIGEAQVLLEKASLRLVRDEWLVDWVVNSTEWPRPLLGSFDERFLHLPREILITVMRDHQKYFAVEDQQGNLRPHFVAVLNVDSDKKGLIRQGHERVLRARFSDAEFFWNADQKAPLDKRQDKLNGVTYQAELGSYGAKVRRMGVIASELCKKLESQGIFRPVDTDWTMRAIHLCKCDLTTQMVQEFPELQGIVGGLYGQAQGENPMVHEAIYDHYLPLGAEEKSPRSIVGAVVSLADKLDSVVAAFQIGREPTGSSDPFALRRQANGLIKVILEYSLPFNLKEIVDKALDVLEVEYATRLVAEYEYFPDVDQIQQAFITEWRTKRQKAYPRVLEFFAERLRYYFESVRGFRYDTVRGVLASGSDVPYEAFLRAQALHNLRGSENLGALCVAAKRIKNILAKSASQSDWSPGEVDESLLAEEAERELYRAYLALDRDTQALARVGDYQLALEAISTLRPSVDTFFDRVLVMAEDKAVRENRLRLLGKLDRMFSGIAQFSEIGSEAETK
jgi:glycyl-tRNA synthetase beta chain